MMKQAEFKIKVEADFSMTKAQLHEKVKHWLEHNAHTCASFGFELKEINHMSVNDD